MFDKTQIDNLLEGLGASLRGDENVFALVDLRLPPEEQIPREIIGEQAEGMIKNGHYHAWFVGPNPSSKANKRLASIEKIKKANPLYVPMKSVAEQLADAQTKAAELEAARKAAEEQARMAVLEADRKAAETQAKLEQLESARAEAEAQAKAAQEEAARKAAEDKAKIDELEAARKAAETQAKAADTPNDETASKAGKGGK